MKVLFVNENIGGHASVHATLRRELAAHPDVSAEFLDVPPPTVLRRIVGHSVPVLGPRDIDLQALRAQLALSQWVRRRLRARLAAGDVDVLHVYTGNAGLRSADLIGSMPSVVSTDATGETNAYRLPTRLPTRHTARAVRAAARFEQPVYDAATLVVANTRWVADSLRTTYAVGEDKLRTFPFGISAPDFGDGPAPGTTRTDGLPRLVFIGRSLERKGALRLHRLHQQHLADRCELVIITPEDVPPGRNVVAVHDVTVGSGRLWEELRSSAAFVFPSQMDQAPNSVIEAMAAGLPVVALDLDALPEMVPPSCGSLVARDDDDALVAVLRTLVDDADLRVRQGTAARARFLAEYDAARSTRRLLDTFAEAREAFVAPTASTRR